MASKIISNELLDKYGLPEETVAEAVELAISQTLTGAMRTTVFSNLTDDGFEIYAMRKNPGDEDPVFIVRPDSIKPKLLRHLQYNIERALHRRKVQSEFDRYQDLQSIIILGEVTKVHKDGSLEVELKREELFRYVTLSAVCPVRNLPQQDRGRLKVDNHYWFYVRKIRPGNVRGMPRLDITLDRVSPKLPEKMVARALIAGTQGLPSEMNNVRCVKRICGASCIIESDKRIHKDIIYQVSKELHEHVYVKFGKKAGRTVGR